MVDDPGMKGSTTKKWSTIFIVIQHTIDHVRNYVHIVNTVPEMIL